MSSYDASALLMDYQSISIAALLYGMHHLKAVEYLAQWRPGTWVMAKQLALCGQIC